MLSLLILSLLKVAVERISPFTIWKENKAILILTALFGVYLLSLSYSEDFSKGLKFVEREIPLLLLPVICAINRSLIQKKVVLLLTFFVAACALNAIATLFFYSLPEPQSIQWVDRLSFLKLKPYEQLSKREAFGVYSPFLDRLQFSNLLAVGFITCIWLFLQGKRKMIVYIILGLILLICSIVLGGKGGQLALAMGLAVGVLVAFFYRVYPKWVQKYSHSVAIGAFLLLSAVGTILLPYTLYQTVPSVTQRYNQMKWELDTYYSDQYQDFDYVHFTTIRRVLSWQNTWELIQKYPLMGVGVGDYEKQIRTIYTQNNPEFPVNSHNHYLFIWANCGIWGLLIFLGSLSYWAYSLFPIQSIQNLSYGLSLLVIFAIIMLFDSLISQVDTMAFGWFLSLGYFIQKAE